MSGVVSVAILEPRVGMGIEFVLNHLQKVADYFHSSCRQFAVLKTLTPGSWGSVAVYVIWDTQPQIEAGLTELPQAEAFQKEVSVVADTLDLNWYVVLCGDTKEGTPSSQICKGSVITLRGISAGLDSKDLVSYSCLAILRAYFQDMGGIISYTFYKSLDSIKFSGVGVWESTQSAFDFFLSPKGSPGEPYWEGLGAKLKHGVFEVTYVVAGT